MAFQSADIEREREALKGLIKKTCPSLYLCVLAERIVKKQILHLKQLRHFLSLNSFLSPA